MRVFGWEISRAKSFESSSHVAEVVQKWTMTQHSQPWLGPVREPFAGAWQKNVQCDSQRNILAFSAVYACVSLIAGDISKLKVRLLREDGDIWLPFRESSPFRPVIRKPNRYQTMQQFISQWLTSKLLHGNTYVLKERDNRGIVVALYVLDPRLVRPVVTSDGGVYYQISRDELAGVDDAVGAVPATEVIHDRGICLWHPLVGVSPIFACGASATQGIRIQANSAAFFENMSRPSGVLTAPATINDATANRLRQDFQNNFGGSNIGRLMIGGDGLKYEPMTMPASDAQLIEQLRWTVEDVGRCFHVPLYKLMSGQNPTFTNAAAMNQDYYSQTLQVLMEDIESLMDEGLMLPPDLSAEFDLTGLMRMDPVAQADANEKEIRAGYLKPNEARRRVNLAPVDGGDTPYLQQQNYALAALAKRDNGDPFPAPVPLAAEDDEGDDPPMMEDDDEPSDSDIEEMSMIASLILSKELRNAQHA